jgi:hypothetical protein
MDAFAFEPQFLDHLAPVWRLLPLDVRGTLRTSPALLGQAEALGLAAEAVDVESIRRLSPPPRAAPSTAGPLAFVTSIGDTKVARRFGYRRLAFMEHGAGQAYVGEQSLAARRHPSYAGGMDREDTELFLVPNDYSARLWRSAYPAARVEVVGCPRLDDLPARAPDGRTTVAISFHWPGFVCPEADTALGTYLSVLPELARRYHVIGHAHPKGDWPRRMARRYEKLGIEFVPSFDDVCRRADVYVVDNSSTLFEFAATGRPVVVLNAPTYRRNVRHGLRFWDAATVGVNVDAADRLIPAVGRALADEELTKRARETALGLVYAYRSGGAERAALALSEWARAASEAAA